MNIIKDIYTVDDWFRLAPPAGGAKQWTDGRSAKELAKAWCGRTSGPAVPNELQELLNTHSDIRGAIILEAIPEHRVSFDDIPGEPRNTDLVCIAQRANQRMAISIEAKADEPFGELITNVLSTPPPSRRPERLNRLCQALLGCRVDDLTRINKFRYQLFYGIGAAISYAAQINASRALFVVHEFQTPNTKLEKLKANERDFQNFLRLLTPVTAFIEQRLYGPIHVPGNDYIPGHIPLYIGKIRVVIGGNEAQSKVKNL